MKHWDHGVYLGGGGGPELINFFVPNGSPVDKMVVLGTHDLIQIGLILTANEINFFKIPLLNGNLKQGA